MKSLLRPGICAVLMLWPVSSHAKLVVLGLEPDFNSKQVSFFYAEESEVNKTIAWNPGCNEEFLPLRKLVVLARSRLKLPRGYVADSNSPHTIQWKHCDLGWMVEVDFYCYSNPKRLLRDGDYVEVIRMLPNGAPVTTKTRAMRPGELNGSAVPAELNDPAKK